MPTILLNNIRPGNKLLKNLKVGSNEVKYVRRGDGKLFYDTRKEIMYSDIEIIEFEYNQSLYPANKNSTTQPSVKYKQIATDIGYGSNYNSWEISEGATVSFSIISGSGASINQNTGVVTWDSRGTVYDLSLKEIQVQVKIVLNGKTKTKTCTIKQDCNAIINLTLVNIDAGSITNPGEVSAEGNSSLNLQSAQDAKTDCKVTFSSGEESLQYSQYVNITTTYSWEEVKDDQGMASFSNTKKSSQIVNISKMPNKVEASRTCVYRRNVTFKAQLKSTYINAQPKTQSTYTDITITQGANKIVSISLIDVNPGSISYNDGNIVPASGLTATVKNTNSPSATVKLKLSSGEEIMANSTYGTLTPKYEWYAEDPNSMLVFTSINSSTIQVQVKSRGTVEGVQRNATLYRKIIYTYKVKASYSSTGNTIAASNNNSTSVKIIQQENIKNIKSIYIVPYQPDSSWIVTVTNGNWDTCPASGGYVKARGYVNYIYTSTSPLNDQKITDDAALTWSENPSWITNHNNGGYSIKNRTTDPGVARSSKATWTYSGLTSESKTLVQAANTITITSISVEAGTLTEANFIASGESKYLETTKASISALLTFSSGSKVTVIHGQSQNYGTWDTITYSVSDTHSACTVSTNRNGAVYVTWKNNKSSIQRTSTVTRTVSGIKFTLKDDYGGASKSSTNTSYQCSCVVTQLKGTKYYGDYYGTFKTNKRTLSAGADSATITYGKIYGYYKWNDENVSSTNNDGSELYKGQVYVTCSESSSYLSGGNGNYTNSSSSEGTCTLTKTTYGTTPANSESATLYLKLGSASGLAISEITIYTTANTRELIYNNPEITSVTSKDIPASGGTFAKDYLTVNYKQTGYYYYTSTESGANFEVKSGQASSSEISFTGTAPFGSNLLTDPVLRAYKGTVTVYVTVNKKTSLGKTVDVYQAQNKVESTNIIDFHIPYFGYSEMGSVSSGGRIYPNIPNNFYQTSSEVYTSEERKNSSSTVAKSSCTIRFSAAASKFTLDSNTGAVSFPDQNWSNYNKIDTILMTVTYGGKSYQRQTIVGQRAQPPNGKVLKISANWNEAVIAFGTSQQAPTYLYNYEQYCAVYIPKNNDIGMGQYFPVYDNVSPAYIQGLSSYGTSQIFCQGQSIYVYQKVKNTSGNWIWQTIGEVIFQNNVPEIAFSINNVQQTY